MVPEHKIDIRDDVIGTTAVFLDNFVADIVNDINIVPLPSGQLK